jgi:hypothetical protein
LKHRLAGVALATLAVPAMILATGSAAQAHYEAVYQGYDYAVIYADHFSGAVCDKEADGHYVYAQFTHGVSEDHDNRRRGRRLRLWPLVKRSGKQFQGL